MKAVGVISSNRLIFNDLGRYTPSPPYTLLTHHCPMDFSSPTFSLLYPEPPIRSSGITHRREYVTSSMPIARNALHSFKPSINQVADSFADYAPLIMDTRRFILTLGGVEVSGGLDCLTLRPALSGLFNGRTKSN